MATAHTHRYVVDSVGRKLSIGIFSVGNAQDENGIMAEGENNPVRSDPIFSQALKLTCQQGDLIGFFNEFGFDFFENQFRIRFIDLFQIALHRAFKGDFIGQDCSSFHPSK